MLKRLVTWWRARLLEARVRTGLACPRCGRLAGSPGTAPLYSSWAAGAWVCACGEFIGLPKELRIWE